MKEKIIWIMLLFLFFAIPSGVSAMKPEELQARGNVCGEKIFEFAIATSDGGVTSKTCYATYAEAKDALNKETDPNAIIIENGVVVDAKYALVDYEHYTDTKYVRVYNNQNLSKEITYIRGGDSDDAALLEVDYNNHKRAKIKVSGVVGWIAKYEHESSNTNKQYEIVPLAWVKSPSYYRVTSEITHFLEENVYGDKGTNTIVLGPKPDILDQGKYYSYDGHYFYKDLITMLDDYRSNSTSRAVNHGNPYYNYYQYLSFRTKTSYNADNINSYINLRTKATSKLRNTGESFIKNQNDYGTNAILMLAIGINESGWGTSPISQNNNNLFGLNAVDATPGQSATYYPTVEDCIEDFAYAWLSYKFLQPGDYLGRFNGAMTGNKDAGITLKYASDPYWGETAASLYYAFDKSYGLQDYQKYQLAVLNNNYSNTVYAKKTAGGADVLCEANGNICFQYRKAGSSIVIVGEEKVGNETWYKIMSDPVLGEDLNYIGSSKSNPKIKYDWNRNYVYVKAEYFTKLSKSGTVIPPDSGEEVNPSPSPSANPSPSPTTSPSPSPSIKPEVAISTIVKTAGYETKNDYLLGITAKTSAADVQKKLSNNGASVTIVDALNRPSTGTIGTGHKVSITSSGKTETLIVVIYGDADGDGTISAVDYVRVKNHIMASGKLQAEYLSAADVDQDGSVSAVDYTNIKNYIMGGNTVIRR